MSSDWLLHSDGNRASRYVGEVLEPTIATNHAADFAVLAIAVHTSLQIFRPNIRSIGNTIEESGLYRHRHWVYLAYAILPPSMSSLAFIRGRYGYRSSGVYCSLPIRPFWYRLAISWIPRYVITLIVAGLYVAVYIHVALQFRSISWLRRVPFPTQRAQPSLAQTSTLYDGIVESPFERQYSMQQDRAPQAGGSKRASHVGPLHESPNNHRRKASSGTTLVEPLPLLERPSIPTSSTAGLATNGRSESMSQDGTMDIITNSFQARNKSADGPSAEPPKDCPSERSTDFFNRGVMREDMRRRHQAIQRQICSLFVYPAIYFLVWLFPFVNHVLNYSDYFAQHPEFWLVLLTYTTLSSMGLCDCVVFSLRERPWRHVPGSSGTFWRSFIVWQPGKNRRGSSSSTFTLTPRRASREEKQEGASSTPHKDPTTGAGEMDPQGAGSGSSPHTARGQRGLASWDFANSVATRQRGGKESYWFDRRLSEAVGMTK